MRIGFIGLGLMGLPMAKNILAKWGDLSVWNRTPERANELKTLGAKICSKKNDLAATVDILITMVTAGLDVEDIFFWLEGTVGALKPGSVVVDMSTIWVEWAKKIGDKLSENDIYFIDAPVTGSTPKAITGELTIFIWGKAEIFEKVKPVLTMMGTNLQYIGPTWSGQAMKLINNTLVAYSMIGLSEVMKLAPYLGISLERTAQVIKTLPVGSPYTTMKVDNFVRDEYPMMFSLANMAKDISLAHAEMEKAGIRLDMLHIAYNQYQKWLQDGIGGLDVSAIGKIS